MFLACLVGWLDFRILAERVFAFVLGQLPERVQVYPTENYYYFGFIHNGVRYQGEFVDGTLAALKPEDCPVTQGPLMCPR